MTDRGPPRQRGGRRDDEWCDCERWREWFDDRMPADRDRETVARTREALIDERLAASIIQTERDRRAERRQRRLAAALDG